MKETDRLANLQLLKLLEDELQEVNNRKAYIENRIKIYKKELGLETKTEKDEN